MSHFLQVVLLTYNLLQLYETSADCTNGPAVDVTSETCYLTTPQCVANAFIYSDDGFKCIVTCSSGRLAYRTNGGSWMLLSGNVAVGFPEDRGSYYFCTTTSGAKVSAYWLSCTDEISSFGMDAAIIDACEPEPTTTTTTSTTTTATTSISSTPTSTSAPATTTSSTSAAASTTVVTADSSTSATTEQSSTTSVTAGDSTTTASSSSTSSSSDSSSTSSITSTSITTSTTASGYCGPYKLANGTYAPNRCVTVDMLASCSAPDGIETCTCSPEYTGTSCSIATASMTSLQTLFGNESTEHLLEMMDEGRDSPAVFTSSLPALLSFISDAERPSLSWDLNDMLIEATFANWPLVMSEDFRMRHDPSLGNCFVFNDRLQNYTYTQRIPGEHGGNCFFKKQSFRALVDAQLWEQAAWSEASGINVYIQDASVGVFAESNRLILRPGKQSLTSFKKDASSDKECVDGKSEVRSFYFDGEYSSDGCYRSCYQDRVLAACGCMDASYVRKEGAPACSFGQLACIEKLRQVRGDPASWAECRCPQPCHTTTFNAISFQTSYSIRRKKTACSLSLRMNTTMPEEGVGNCTQSSSEVVIFFDSPVAVVQVEQLAVTFSSLVGALGGLSGLFLGASLICVLELVLLAGGPLVCRGVTNYQNPRPPLLP